MSYLKGFSALSVLIAMLLPVSPAWGQDPDPAALYTQRCGSCHNNGIGPALTSDALQPRLIARGLTGLYNSAINGRGNMPQCITLGNTSDADCRAIVDYMLSAAGIPVAKTLYDNRCASCHDNIPAISIQTNPNSWQGRFDMRMLEGLYNSAIKGRNVGNGNMPACSSITGMPSLTDDPDQVECKAIVDYMLGVAGVSIPPPTPPTTDIDIDLRLFLEGSVKPPSADE